MEWIFACQTIYFSTILQKNTKLLHLQRSMCGRCPAPGSHSSQAAWHWVSTWMGDRRSAACISKRWAGHFFRDCRLGTDLVKWPTISTQVFRSFPVPSWKCDIQHRREWQQSHSQGGDLRREDSERKGKRGWWNM